METLEKAILFTSDRFDFRSELPEDDNAGNRLYGRDLAAYLCERLRARKLDADFLDEDWGWLILGKATPGASFEIAVYNFNENEHGRPGAPEWGLRMRASRCDKLFWRFHKTVKVAIPPAVEAAVLEAIGAIGAQPRPWADGPEE